MPPLARIPKGLEMNTPMTLKEFVSHGVACGGNWTAMLLSGLKEVNRPLWDSLPDKEYSFNEVLDILVDNGVILPADKQQ